MKEITVTVLVKDESLEETINLLCGTAKMLGPYAWEFKTAEEVVLAEE